MKEFETCWFNDCATQRLAILIAHDGKTALNLKRRTKIENCGTLVHDRFKRRIMAESSPTF